MVRELDNYYLRQEEPVRGCLLALSSFILGLDSNIAPAWKYSMPFFCYKGKMFCYLWIDKISGHPYIGIVEGNKLDIEELEQGSRSRMKILKVDPTNDLDIGLITLVLNEALNLYKTGIVKLK